MKPKTKRPADPLAKLKRTLIADEKKGEGDMALFKRTSPHQYQFCQGWSACVEYVLELIAESES